MDNLFVHTEFQAKDVQQAMKWYGELFGWDTNYMPEMNYATFSDGRTGGGFYSNDNYHGTISYVRVDNYKDTLAKVKDTGGKVVVEPVAMEGLGTFAILADPAGNYFGVIQFESNEAPPPQPKQYANFITHIEFRAQDIAKLLDWYAAVFSWEVNHIPEMNYGMIMTSKDENAVTGGVSQLGESGPMAIAYIHVDDVDAIWKKAIESGAKSVSEPFDVPTVGRMAHFADNHGNVIGILKYAQPE